MDQAVQIVCTSGAGMTLAVIPELFMGVPGCLAFCVSAVSNN